MPSYTEGVPGLLSGLSTPEFRSYPSTLRPRRSASVSLVQGLLRSGEVAMIVGAANAGKTTVAIDLVQRIARGMPWHGLPTRECAVLVCCAEAPEAFEAAEDAWLRRHDLTASQNVFRMEHAFDLDNRGQVSAFIEHVRAQEDTFGVKFGLVIFDTLADFLGRAEENNNTHLRPVNDNLRRISSELSVCSLPLHHYGKDEGKGPRGGTALNAKLDARLDCWSEGDLTKLAVGKLRRGQKGRVFTFRRESEIVGVDCFGEPETACVVLAQPDTQPAAGAGNSLPLEAALLGIVRAATKPLAWTEVRKRLMGLGFAKTDKDRKEAERLRDRLQREGKVIYQDGAIHPGPAVDSPELTTVANDDAALDAVSTAGR